MFESLDDKMKLDDAVGTSRGEQLMKYSIIAIFSVLAFGGLYLGLMLLEG